MPHDPHDPYDPEQAFEQARLEVSELEHIERKAVLGLSVGYHPEQPLSEDDLVDVPARAWFRAIQTIRKRSTAEVIEPLIIREQLVRDGVGEHFSPVELAAPVTSGEFHAAAARVHQESLVRRTDARLRQALEVVRGEGRDMPPEHLQERVTTLIGDAFQGAGRDKPTTDDEALAALRDKLDSDQRLEGVVSSANPDQDEITGGAAPGQLIILAAATGCGKSAYMLQWATHIVVQHGPAAVVSLEMTSEEVAFRMGQQMTRRKLEDITPADVEKARLISRLGPLYIWDRGNTLQRLGARIGNLKMRHPNLQAVFVDYLSLLRDRSFGAGKTYHEVSAIARGLKDMAMEHRVPIIALHQLSRGVHARADKRPTLSDLRDSGVIEEAANQVLFLYREGYATREPGPGPAELIIAKNRSGRLGKVRLRWEPDYVSYYPVTTRDDEPGPAPPPASFHEQTEFGFQEEEVPL